MIVAAVAVWKVLWDVAVYGTDNWDSFKVVFYAEFPVCYPVQHGGAFFDVAFIEGHCA